MRTDAYDNGPVSLRLASAFSPAAPVNSSALFAGRIRQIQEVCESVNQTGQHAALLGERSVGKTSLANVLSGYLARTGVRGLLVSRVNCDTGDSFSRLWNKTLRELQNRLGPLRKRRLVDMAGHTVPEDPRPEDIRFFLQQAGGRFLLIFDEFDRLKNEATARSIADLIKSLSDHAVPGTIVLVGVADSIDQLISDHQSIDRCLVQVHVPRMRRSELSSILESGFSQARMRIDQDASDLISFLAHGLPHYAHLIGLASGRAALAKRRSRVRIDDVLEDIQQSVHQVPRSIASGYEAAMSAARGDQMFERVLLACGLAPIDDLGWFGPDDVQESLVVVADRRYDLPAFADHLDQFCRTDKEPTLQKKDKEESHRFRFTQPLLQPYVLLRGLAQGFLSVKQVTQYRRSNTI